MQTKIIINNVAEYCTDLLSNSSCNKLPFHNLQHTIEVVQNVKHLCAAMNINQQETDMLIIAAWFHDTGFSVTYKGHEEESKLIATAFLKTQEVNIDFIDKICNCIDATKMPQCPTSNLAKILCDADVFHISNSHFFYRKLLLRKEWELFCDNKVSDVEWHKLNLDFLKKHHFKTTYGKNILTTGKQENILKIERILDFY